MGIRAAFQYVAVKPLICLKSDEVPKRVRRFNFQKRQVEKSVRII